jgi:hypothetical protein
LITGALAWFEQARLPTASDSTEREATILPLRRVATTLADCRVGILAAFVVEYLQLGSPGA